MRRARGRETACARRTEGVAAGHGAKKGQQNALSSKFLIGYDQINIVAAAQIIRIFFIELIR